MSESILQIITDYLTANGYGGIRCPAAECGCFLNDLFPCGESCHPDDMYPAYKVPCRADCVNEECDEYRRGEADVWCLTTEKPEDESCSTCGGKGKYKEYGPTGTYYVGRVVDPCPACHGTGKGE